MNAIGRTERVLPALLCALGLHVAQAPAARPQEAAPDASVLLVDAGRARCTVEATWAAGRDSTAVEWQAAAELVAYLERISGARLEPAGNGAPGLRRWAAAPAPPPASQPPPVHLRIGPGAMTPEMAAAIARQGDDPASFALFVRADSVRIAGLSPEGTRCGVYEVLEQLGVRWYMPGELGTVVPTSPAVALPLQETVQVPSFGGRWHDGYTSTVESARAICAEWGRHVRMGGPYFPSSHGLPVDDPTPEMTSLVGGQRGGGQLCLSHPEVLRQTVRALQEACRADPAGPHWFGMGPNDGGGYCQCEACRALDGGDWDPFGQEPSVTDRYVWFFNQVLEQVKPECPDAQIGFYAYSAYMRPPVKVKPSPHIIPALAPITLCRLHGMGNPVCPERSYLRYLEEAWGRILPQVYERGYWFNLADPGFPMSHVHRMRDEIPAAKGLGIKGWRTETMNHWGSETPSLYLAARLMWDAGADVDALLQDFDTRFFGPAAAPMGQYLETMDAAVRDADHHTGSSFAMPLLYPAALRQRARGLLAQAAVAAGDRLYGERVTLFRRTFQYLEAFIDMLAHRSALDWVAARADLERVRALRDTLVAYSPPMVGTVASQSYLDRFFSPCTEQGYARVTGGSRMVAGLQDVWEFALDPQDLGQEIGLWRPQAQGGNWQNLRTTSASWSDQGLRYYKGVAWYRQAVHLPPVPAGRRVVLWFGGVDEAARVWVNGTPIGEASPGAFVPFELDATGAVVPEAVNLVVVRVSNASLDELGTGGITAPVMFYAPPAQGEPGDG
ncbi:MAG: DUF4838 domain-containing protein [Candidatus Latescibacterota bacterium]